jgi:hypothetical protein
MFQKNEFITKMFDCIAKEHSPINEVDNRLGS